MSGISVNLALRHGAFQLDAAFQTPSRGVTAIFGPSGSGKTTLLRCIAGLSRGAGVVRVKGETWQDDATRVFAPTHARAIGYVFQESSLFPHLSVERNLLFGWRRTPESERRIEAPRVIDWLRLKPLLARMPERLSGGERQRVALGRALLSSPKLLLLDEPLSALDATSRHEIMPLLAQLHHELEMPVLLVSHALNEVARLADHVVHLKDGRAIAAGVLHELMPQLGAEGSDYVCALTATVLRHDEAYNLSELDTALGRLWASRVDAAIGGIVQLQIAARDVSLSHHRETSSILNQFDVVIDTVHETRPGQALVSLRPPNRPGVSPLFALITRKSWDQLQLAPGAQVIARVKGVTLGFQ